MVKVFPYRRTQAGHSARLTIDVVWQTGGDFGSTASPDRHSRRCLFEQKVISVSSAQRKQPTFTSPRRIPCQGLEASLEDTHVPGCRYSPSVTTHGTLRTAFRRRRSRGSRPPGSNDCSAILSRLLPPALSLLTSDCSADHPGFSCVTAPLLDNLSNGSQPFSLHNAPAWCPFSPSQRDTKRWVAVQRNCISNPRPCRLRIHLRPGGAVSSSPGSR